ncbi:MAG: adenosylmethionine--8-amino-7-oxononanoate transaminase [Candidatus Lambdaproteobacteria bacterium]|nr:adenosylmethionine--8-amino-7-oxononanoate transaminase [Candidatus Lambdaproteobacteria bacterium]
MQQARPLPTVVQALDAVLYLAGGAEVIDAISSWWVITHGHSQPEIAAAIAEQACRLDQVIFAEFTHEPAEEVARELVALLPPGLAHVFFSDNGSTAVEIALKMALQACRQRGEPRRTRFLAFSEAYHGDTVGAMSVGAAGVFTEPYRELLFPVLRAGQGRCSDDPPEAWLGDFRALLERHHAELAAVILEPLIQGAGGMIVWPEAAVREIAELCRRAGVLLIFDEVMTGFGRTGALFALEKLGVTPDLLCLSKGLTGGALPLAATIATRQVYAAFLSEDRRRTFFHGHSFTANPIACAAAAANLRLLAEPAVRARWRRIEAIHRQRLARLAGRPILRDGRCCGIVAAVELASPRAGYLDAIGPALHDHALARGVLLRPLGHILYILPPFSITDEQLHRVWDVVEECMALAERQAARP